MQVCIEHSNSSILQCNTTKTNTNAGAFHFFQFFLSILERGAKKCVINRVVYSGDHQLSRHLRSGAKSHTLYSIIENVAFFRQIFIEIDYFLWKHCTKPSLICRQFKSTLLLNLSSIAIAWESSNSYCTIRNIPFNFWVGVLLNRFSFFSDCLCACVFFSLLKNFSHVQCESQISFFCPAPMHNLVGFLSVRFWAYFLIHILNHQQLIHVFSSRKVDSLSGQFPFCFIRNAYVNPAYVDKC